MRMPEHVELIMWYTVFIGSVVVILWAMLR